MQKNQYHINLWGMDCPMETFHQQTEREGGGVVDAAMSEREKEKCGWTGQMRGPAYQ